MQGLGKIVGKNYSYTFIGFILYFVFISVFYLYLVLLVIFFLKF